MPSQSTFSSPFSELNDSDSTYDTIIVATTGNNVDAGKEKTENKVRTIGTLVDNFCEEADSILAAQDSEAANANLGRLQELQCEINSLETDLESTDIYLTTDQALDEEFQKAVHEAVRNGENLRTTGAGLLSSARQSLFVMRTAHDGTKTLLEKQKEELSSRDTLLKHLVAGIDRSESLVSQSTDQSFDGQDPVHSIEEFLNDLKPKWIAVQRGDEEIFSEIESHVQQMASSLNHIHENLNRAVFAKDMEHLRTKLSEWDSISQPVEVLRQRLRSAKADEVYRYPHIMKQLSDIREAVTSLKASVELHVRNTQQFLERQTSIVQGEDKKLFMGKIYVQKRLNEKETSG